MQHTKKISITFSFLLVSILLIVVVYGVAFDWTIGSDWTLGSDWTTGAEEEGDSYTLLLSVTNPTTTTYPDGADNIPVEVEDTGNGTNTVITYNFQHSNGTWLFGSNQTYTVPIDVTIQEYRNSTWTFSVHGINDELVEDYEEVEFNVQYLTAYTLSITGTGVSNTTITIDSQAWSATSSGNETNPAWQIELLYANRSVAVANSSSASGTWTSLVNGTSYIACFSVTGDNEASDYEEVMFTYQIIDTYTLSITIINPTVTTYTDGASNIPVEVSISTNGTNAVTTYNFQHSNGTWLFAENQTYTESALITINEARNSTWTFCVYSVNDELANDYTEIVFDVQYITYYTISISRSSPTNSTYRPLSVTATYSLGGNGSSQAISWNLYFANGTALYESNQTDLSKLMEIGEEGTFTLGCVATDTEGSYDYDEVVFTIAANYIDYAAVAIVAFAVTAAATIAFAWRRIRRPTVRTSGILRMYDPYSHILLFGVTRL